MTFQRYGRLAAVTFAGALAITACGGGPPGATSGGGDQLSGDVRIDGSSTVAPLTQAATELFNAEQPRVRIAVGTSGTGGGFEKFCNGETDISNASRAMKSEEKENCDAKGIKFEEFTVANDALTVVVNKDNDWADCLTTAQLQQIWAPKSKVKTWNQVDPKFPAEPLALFGPGTDSGTFDYFTDEINGEEGASRTDYSPSENDNVTVQGVSGSRGGMGYFGFSYFEENSDKLKALKIDGGDGCVEPSIATAQDGSYEPLSRPLFVYPKAESLRKPQVEKFVEYYVQNAARIAEESGFVPLNESQKAELAEDLETLRSYVQ